MSSGGVAEAFSAAVERAKGGGGTPPSSDEMLKMYALYKQATVGDNATAKPGMFDPVGGAKWKAWTALASLSKEDAMRAYTTLMEQLNPAAAGGQQQQQQEQQQQSDAANHGSAPGLISVEVASNGVATVFLDSVTMPPAMFVQCGKVFRLLSDDEAVKVVVVRAGKAKPHFSYGLDLKQAGGSLMKSKMDGPRHHLHKLVKEWQEGFTAVAECRAPVIAAVEGWCIGAGLDLISAADVRLCSRDAKISLREAALGIVADLGSLQRLPTVIGDAHTRWMALTACDVGADRAREIGLVSEVCDDAQALYARAEAMASEMASRDPNCMMGIKSVMNRARDAPVREGLEYVGAWNSAHIPLQDIAAKLMGGTKT